MSDIGLILNGFLGVLLIGGTRILGQDKGDAAKGKATFEEQCSVCHNAAPFDQRKVGPGLGNLFHDPQHPNLVTGAVATPKNVAAIIQHGAHGDMGVMPDMHANGLTPKDVADLVAYLQSLHK